MQLYNTLTRSKETLDKTDKPLTIYTCGPTVYLDPQIGNWRMFIFYDTLIRSLQILGYQTNHVINITDVGHLVSDEDSGEDKLVMQAQKERKTAWDIAENYTQKYLEGRKTLNMLAPDYMPKATDMISEQISLIQAIEAKGATYQLDDGIYFDIATFPDYGKLARLSLEGQQAGARVEENSQKRQPQDFALWKFSPQGAKRDMEWESPWGKGFPGWHIECSAMAKTLLGDTIDIHAGGIDHIPVHHTNEIAQSETANGTQYAKCWVHGGFMLVDGTKLSKSLGNSYSLEDITNRGFSHLAFRLLVLQAHYRSETNFTWESLSAAQERLKSLYAFAELRWQAIEAQSKQVKIKNAIKDMKEAISDDINTPRVLELISSLQNECSGGIPMKDKELFNELLTLIDDLLGLQLLEQTPDISNESKQLIAERNSTRQSGNYQTADNLRNQITESGILLNDFGSYTIWYTKR